MLTTVTLTGADDSVDPAELVRLSQMFPFVEWGILVGSRSMREAASMHAFSPRWPSLDWMDRLSKAVERSTCVKLSLHLCGKALESLFDRSVAWWTFMNQCPYQRVQLNFHGEPVTDDECNGLHTSIVTRGAERPFTPIVQLDGLNDDILEQFRLSGICADGLYDTSHGAGKLPGEWPKADPNWNVGYAGGLGPDNVAAELPRIALAAGGRPYWIDMETKLRTQVNHDDVFDLAKCEAVLHAAFEFMQRERDAADRLASGVM